MAPTKKHAGLRKKRAASGRPFVKGIGGPPGTRFVKGHSIKSPGRPRLPPGYNEAFELMEPEAWEAIRDIVKNPVHKDRQKASEYVVNRRRGKPTERTEVTGAGGGPLIPPSASAAVEALRKLVEPSEPPKGE
jgi:hypothetical protein